MVAKRSKNDDTVQIVNRYNPVTFLSHACGGEQKHYLRITPKALSKVGLRETLAHSLILNLPQSIRKSKMTDTKTTPARQRATSNYRNKSLANINVVISHHEADVFAAFQAIVDKHDGNKSQAIKQAILAHAKQIQGG